MVLRNIMFAGRTDCTTFMHVVACAKDLRLQHSTPRKYTWRNARALEQSSTLRIVVMLGKSLSNFVMLTTVILRLQ